MKLDFSELYDLLREDPVVTYKLQHEVFHSPINKHTKIWYGKGAAMLLNHSLHMYGEPNSLDVFLAELESGSQYEFFGVPKTLLPLLRSHFRQINIDEDCTAYTLSKEDFRGDAGDVLDSLTPADAEFVNQRWQYKFEGSKEFFRHILAHYPSSAVRIGGRLAGWAVCYDATDDMINMGSLRVLEPYRQQGLGRKLSIDLVRKVMKLNKTPMVHILDSNTASKTLSMGIGFKPHREKIFWGKGIKK